MADQAPQQVQLNPTLNPNSFYAIAEIAMPAGTPVYQTSVKNVVAPATSNSQVTTYLLGLTVNGCEEGAQVEVQYAGPLTLTVAEWEAVTNGGAGLVAGTGYFVSSTHAGQIAPQASIGGGDYFAPVGFATSSTTMKLQISLAQTTAP